MYHIYEIAASPPQARQQSNGAPKDETVAASSRRCHSRYTVQFASFVTYKPVRGVLGVDFQNLATCHGAKSFDEILRARRARVPRARRPLRRRTAQLVSEQPQQGHTTCNCHMSSSLDSRAIADRDRRTQCIAQRQAHPHFPTLKLESLDPVHTCSHFCFREPRNFEHD
jgi:hypothetical protein